MEEPTEEHRVCVDGLAIAPATNVFILNFCTDGVSSNFSSQGSGGGPILLRLRNLPHPSMFQPALELPRPLPPVRALPSVPAFLVPPPSGTLSRHPPVRARSTHAHPRASHTRTGVSVVDALNLAEAYSGIPLNPRGDLDSPCKCGSH
jgi:hypothetical protein